MCEVKTDAQKNAQRKQFKALRRTMPQSQKENFDLEIFKKVCALPEYKNADTIFAYVSTAIEIDTLRIIEDALQNGKTVAVPRCVAGTRNMEFYKIETLRELEEGAYGILEPPANPQKKQENFKSGLCIVPALCYDKEGYRLGYGGGYYDRFLPQFQGNTVGLTYEVCFLDTLSRGRYDCAVQTVVTEARILKINKF